MIMPRLALVSLLVSAMASSIDAFAFTANGGAVSFGATACRSVRASTCLWAKKGEDAKEEPESAEAVKPITDSGTDIMNSPAFLKRKLDVLKSDIATQDELMEEAKKRLEEGKAEFGPQLEGLQKEYQNIQNRMSSQTKTGDTQAIIKVVRQMLQVLDNYDRAFGVVTAETDAEKEIELEYKSAYDMILSIFEELGVQVVDTVGTEFDYEYHQAVMQRPSEEYEEGIVCEELQKGFKLGDQLIRAAMVSVAA